MKNIYFITIICISVWLSNSETVNWLDIGAKGNFKTVFKSSLGGNVHNVRSIVFNGYIYIFAPYRVYDWREEIGTLKSNDGINWQKIGQIPMKLDGSSRASFVSRPVVFQAPAEELKMWLILDRDFNDYKFDIYSSTDGINWELRGQNSEMFFHDGWANSTGDLINSDNTLYFFAKNHVFSSQNGITWNEVNGGVYNGIYGPDANYINAIQYNNKFYITGGTMPYGGHWRPLGKIWESTNGYEWQSIYNYDPDNFYFGYDPVKFNGPNASVWWSGGKTTDFVNIEGASLPADAGLVYYQIGRNFIFNYGGEDRLFHVGDNSLWVIAGKYSLSGTVYSNKKPLTLFIEGLDNDFTTTITTEADGKYLTALLPVGSYRITPEAQMDVIYNEGSYIDVMIDDHDVGNVNFTAKYLITTSTDGNGTVSPDEDKYIAYGTTGLTYDVQSNLNYILSKIEVSGIDQPGVNRTIVDFPDPENYTLTLGTVQSYGSIKAYFKRVGKDVSGKILGENPETTCGTVQIVGTDPAVNESADVDANGNFKFVAIPPGVYTISPNGYPTYDYCPKHTLQIQVVDQDVYVEFTQLDLQTLAIDYTPKAADNSVSPEEEVHFSAVLAGAEPVSYTWVFGDGSLFVNDVSPVHIFKHPGNFTVYCYMVFCENLKKTITRDIVVKCNTFVPPILSLTTEKPGKISDPAKEIWKISDYCPVGSEPVDFMGVAVKKICTGNITSWEWKLNDAPVTGDLNTNTIVVANNDAVQLTVTDANGKKASIKKTIQLIPCRPEFKLIDYSKPAISLKRDGKFLNGKYVFLDEGDQYNVDLTAGGENIDVRCACLTADPTTYQWSVNYVYDNSVVGTGTGSTIAFKTTKGYGDYVITLHITRNMADGSAPITEDYQREFTMTFYRPQIACPEFGCRTSPLLCSDFYEEIQNRSFSDETDLLSGSLEETLEAQGDGVASMQGLGSFDDCMLKSARVPGDFSFIAHVNDVASLGSMVQAGVMVRKSAAIYGRMLYLGLNGGFVQMAQRARPHQDVALFPIMNTSPIAPNTDTWLKIERTGEEIKCYTSGDGATWNGPFGIAGVTTFGDWGGTVDVGIIAAGDNDDFAYQEVTFDNIKFSSIGQYLPKLNLITNTVFAGGNLVSNWSFESIDNFFTSANKTWYNGRFEETNTTPAYEGRYFLRTTSKPAARELITPPLNVYYEKNGTSSKTLSLSFMVRSDASITITPAIKKYFLVTGTAEIQELTPLTISTTGVWTSYKVIFDIPANNSYSSFALLLLSPNSSNTCTIDFDNILLTPLFPNESSKPVTTITFANGNDEVFQTLQTSEDKDVVAALVLDDEGRTVRSLPIFTKKTKDAGGNLVPDCHKVKVDPYKDMQDYLKNPTENRVWTLNDLAEDYGRVRYEDNPLNRVLKAEGRTDGMDVMTSYTTDSYGQPDGLEHRTVAATKTGFDFGGFHFSKTTEFRNAYDQPVRTETYFDKYKSGFEGPIVATMEPDILGRNWKTTSPMGQECDPDLDPNCITPSTVCYSTLDKIIESNDADAGIAQTLFDKIGNARLFRDANEIKNKQILVTVYDNFSRALRTYIVHNPDGSRWKQYNADDPLWPENQTGYSSWATKVLSSVYDEAPASGILPVGLNADMFHNTKGRITASIAHYSSGDVGTFYSYDERGNINTIWQAVPNVPLHMRKVTYNMAGQVTTRTTEGQIPVKGTNFTKSEAFVYDELNRLLRVTGKGNKTIASFSYTPDGKVATKQLGVNQRIKYMHEIGDRVESIVHETYNTAAGSWEKSGNWEQDLTYNAQGNIQKQNYKLPGSGISAYRSVKYTYDGFNRLKNADYGASTTGFDNINWSDMQFDESAGYNNDGAITSLGRKANAAVGLGGAYTYYPHTHRLKKVTGYIVPGGKNRGAVEANYEYDNNGNMITDHALKQRIEYDYRNMPVRVIQYNDDALTQVKKVTEFLYDAEGNRVKKSWGN